MTHPDGRPNATATAALALLSLGLTGAVAAQDAPEVRARWETGPLKAGWCVQFLMEPKRASKDLARGYEVVAVHESEGWHPALRRAAESDPAYAPWVPARVCQLLFDTVWVGGRHYERGSKNSPVGLAFWEVAARRSPGPGGAPGVARLLATNSGDLQRRMEGEFIPLRLAQLTVAPIEGRQDQRFELKLDRTIITFEGHPVPDSTPQTSEVRYTLAMDGERMMRWTIEVRLDPTNAVSFPGGLRFHGKGDLLQALARSPIRMVGPVFSGGRGAVTFAR
jgi:hypothetical protein